MSESMKITSPAAQPGAWSSGSTAATRAAMSTGAPLPASSCEAIIDRPARPDRYEPAPRAAAVTSSRAEEPARAGDNPFAELRRAELARPERELAARVSMERELDPSLDAAERLAALGRHLVGHDLRALGRLLRGMMLVTHDAQAQRAERAPIAAEVVEKLAAAMARRGEINDEELTALLRQGVLALNVRRVDIVALVQRLLRESYLLSSEAMLDMAKQLERANELRKAVRDEAQRARQTKTCWAELSRSLPEGAFLAEEPYAALRVDHDTMSLVPALTTEEDVEQWLAQATRRAAGGAQGQATQSEITLALAQLDGESRLTAEDRLLLNELVNGDDDIIAAHMDELTPMLGRMNAADLREYLVPILNELKGGAFSNTNEEEILAIYSLLSPVQVLFLAAVEVDSADFGFGEHDATELRLIIGRAALRVAEMMGGEAAAELEQVLVALRGGPVVVGCWVGGEGTSAKVVPQLADLRGFLPTRANALLGALRLTAREQLTHAESASASADAPRVGAPKLLRTVEQLDDYLKALEDDLNSIGEDAQLLNVDLQQRLQAQQQTLQMMSNISKTMHETAMAIIRRIGN